MVWVGWTGSVRQQEGEVVYYVPNNPRSSLWNCSLKQHPRAQAGTTLSLGQREKNRRGSSELSIKRQARLLSWQNDAIRRGEPKNPETSLLCIHCSCFAVEEAQYFHLMLQLTLAEHLLYAKC